MACAMGSVSASPLSLGTPGLVLGSERKADAPAPAPVPVPQVAKPLNVGLKSKAQLPLPQRMVYQFPEDHTWVENLYVRDNGDILMTMMWPKASLYLLKNPSTSPEGTEPTLIHTFDDAQGLLGIAETAPDTFAVISSKFSAMAAVVAGGSAIWEVSIQDVANPKVRKITDLPEGGFLNGMVKLHSAACRNVAPADRKTVLVSDSFNGLVYRVNTNTGAYEVAVKVPEMDPVAGAALPFGVNGIKIMGHYLYWANSDHTSMYRVAVDMATGHMRQGAKVETLVTLKDTAFLDEFDIDEDGTIWGVTNADNKLIAMRPNAQNGGSYEVVLGSNTEMTLAGDTSARFGKGAGNRRTLYITTGGASVVPVNGTITEPAKLVAVDTRGYLNL
ncbi:hypothetical protein PG993_003895 [Apiospora rasikravindrae]|uniref:SMP-30/Gluconolactonase/LRE-like region domain-containing protein n=1 Tax=Apiospora rasikravindrae TaxID=990691 RepID=A0ABR1U0T1_9PEZI